MPLAGGIMQYGFQCGMLWGAALAAGTQAYQLYGSSPQAEAVAVIAAQRLVESFRTRNKSINCVDITNMDKSSTAMDMVVRFLVKGGVIGCFRMAATYAPVAFDDINISLSEEYNQAPSPPVSCAAVLAKKMGVSDMHAVMVAGFAGGIGLSGGACGALGAAIWVIGMDSGKEGIENIEYMPSRASDAVDRFVESSDFEFECAAIVGRKFESVGDHADYVHEGGCAKIIEVLAAS